MGELVQAERGVGDWTVIVCARRDVGFNSDGRRLECVYT